MISSHKTKKTKKKPEFGVLIHRLVETPQNQEKKRQNTQNSKEGWKEGREKGDTAMEGVKMSPRNERGVKGEPTAQGVLHTSKGGGSVYTLKNKEETPLLAFCDS